MVFEMVGRCPYSCCFVGCCLQHLFHTDRSILVQLSSSFLSKRFVSVHVVHPYSSIDTTSAWKKYCVLFHLIGLTSIWPIVYRWLSLTSPVMCHFTINEQMLVFSEEIILYSFMGDILIMKWMNIWQFLLYTQTQFLIDLFKTKRFLCRLTSNMWFTFWLIYCLIGIYII